MSKTSERLRRLREQKGLSQGEVAKAIGVSRPAYVSYETGKSRPTRTVQKLASYFQVSTDYILGQTDIPEPLPPYINKNLTPEQLAKFKADIASLTKGGKFDWSLIGPPVPVDDDTPQASPQDTPQVTPQVIPDILTPDERECIRKYRALTDDQRGAIKNQIDYFYTKSISEDSAKDGAS